MMIEKRKLLVPAGCKKLFLFHEQLVYQKLVKLYVISGSYFMEPVSICNMSS